LKANLYKKKHRFLSKQIKWQTTLLNSDELPSSSQSFARSVV
jgi:hypothetical protein